jgi:hypothetical protein
MHLDIVDSHGDVLRRKLRRNTKEPQIGTTFPLITFTYHFTLLYPATHVYVFSLSSLICVYLPTHPLSPFICV